MIAIRFPTARQLLLTLALAEAEGGERLSSSQVASGRGAHPMRFCAQGLLIALKYALEGAIVLGAPERRHLIAVSHIPPSPGAFESRVADKFVGRLDAPTAHWPDLRRV